MKVFSLFLLGVDLFSNVEYLVVQLAGTNRPIALAQANAVLNRIDLLCEVIAFSCHDLSMLAVLNSKFVVLYSGWR